MKKPLAIMLTIFLSVFAQDSDRVSVKGANQLSQEQLISFFNGDDTQTILKFSQEDIFPLNFDYHSDFFSLNKPVDLPYSMTVTRDFFVRSSDKRTFLFSLDGNTWKTLIELVSGNFQIGLGIDEQSKGSFVSIGGHLFERTEGK